MEGLFLSTTLDRTGNKRITSSWTNKTLFSKTKPSDEWRHQINFTAGLLTPTDPTFPWSQLQKHTTTYLKKKGKASQSETDIRLAALIESYEPRDIAIAACAHAMSPTSLRALLNADLTVSPTTFYGLDTHLQSLVAANTANPPSITHAEATWARRLLPYAQHGADAPGRFLKGLCTALSHTAIPNMSALPSFAILARRACADFATRLQGLKLRCEWPTAHAEVKWMADLAASLPPPPPSPHHQGRLLPEHVLDVHMPVWRVWARWKPDCERVVRLGRLVGCERRGVVPDVMALEGPDFITGCESTMREGVVRRYGARGRFVRVRGLVFEVDGCRREVLGGMLGRVLRALDRVVGGGVGGEGEGGFGLFVGVLLARPITEGGLDLLDAVGGIPVEEAERMRVCSLVRTLYAAQEGLGGEHVFVLQEIIPVLSTAHADGLRRVLLVSWFLRGIERCVRECQAAIRAHITNGLHWTCMAIEFHAFCLVVKRSKSLLELLHEDIQKQLAILPGIEELRTIVEIYDEAQNREAFKNSVGPNILKESIEYFCIDRLIERDVSSGSSECVTEAISQALNGPIDKQRRTLAIVVSKYVGADSALYIKCIEQAVKLSLDNFKDFLNILEPQKGKELKIEERIIAFTGLLARTNDERVVSCWREVLYNMMEYQSKPNLPGDAAEPQSNLIDYSLNHRTAEEWYKFILDLQLVFDDLKFATRVTPLGAFLAISLDWIKFLRDYIPAITKFEKALGKSNLTAVRCILKGGDDCLENFTPILDALNLTVGKPLEKVVQDIAGRLTEDDRFASTIAECLAKLMRISPVGTEACQRIWDAKQDTTISTAVNEVMLAGYLQSQGQLTDLDKEAVMTLGSVLSLTVYQHAIPKQKIEEATAYFESQEIAILKEAERLNGVRKALKWKDPLGTAVLLKSLGIRDTTQLDEDIASLPASVLNAIERVEDEVIDMSFPLTFTDLQCSSMGVGTAKTLFVRLYFDFSNAISPAFCIHLDSESPAGAKDSLANHTSWACNHKPNSSLTYKLDRELSHYLGKTRETHLADIHNFITNTLQHPARSCITCAQPHKTKTNPLRRPFPCALPDCTRLWSKLPLDVRIPEIRTDPFAIDLLLTSVYAAAQTGRTDLLPGCPISPPSHIVPILNSLPSTSVLKDAINLSATLHSCHKQAEQLLAWSCTHFGGHLTTASGPCRIPSLAGTTHQFVLASARPGLEASFAAAAAAATATTARANPQTRILFHGTSLDRLPAILAQGLRVKSGSALQRTGAAHGRGIYLAKEPGFSFSYAPAAVSWRNSGLSNVRLLLGCEVVEGGKKVNGGIHVVQEEKAVAVRFVWLFGNGAYVPVANHVVGPMASVCAALRGGTA